MLGKDYMLAIILVNCDDNLWNDQNMEGELDLPSGWRKIHDSSGTYYWHVPTGTTQWQHPSRTSGVGDAGEAAFPETDSQPPVVRCVPTETFIPSPVTSFSKRKSLAWHKEDLHQGNPEPGSKGQNMVMILKEDTMNLVDPLDHSLIHCQPIINIRVWGVGCNKGRDRDFAFVASDKDTCVLKCHVFHCNVPGKAIAKALHEMCSKIMAEQAVASSSLSRSITLESFSPNDISLQADILDVVRESVQKYKAFYIGSLPVSKSMGIDVLNNAIETLMGSRNREQWIQAVVSVSDSVMQANQTEAEEEKDPCIWECQVRYVTFIGIGKDAHTFGLIVDMGKQHFQCTAFWCEPDAGTISEAVQAACMVQYQKCLVASRMRTKSSSHSIMKLKRTMSLDSPVCSFPITGPSLQKTSSGATTCKRGLFSFFETFRQKHSILHTS
ncbi:PREDICTED: amyloid beta A4 precursor protein-binding family B member 3 isoform X3 [Thamnophis sirtalis]|uniref:Amyloid beta A4 precursor protein-binding family B member 3 isoform X3 n=1 Tax=Thamnophis sirtalis TaxID=35019 RepID=A0A6I9YDG1_9SAUR|nr:PREDICTED: amyloid beta A4 precursor protein-binding family B member 3 isoform X3 [Thamnophis sirtalis]